MKPFESIVVTFYTLKPHFIDPTLRCIRSLYSLELNPVTDFNVAQHLRFTYTEFLNFLILIKISMAYSHG